MRQMKRRAMQYLSACACVAITSATLVLAHGEERNQDFAVKGGCVVRARAYVDKNYRPGESSRFFLEIVGKPKDSYQWDFTLEDDPDYHYTGSLNGGVSPSSYGSKKQATLHATLHQYDIYEERVTFKNLDVKPFPGLSESVNSDIHPRLEITPRFLSLKAAVTQTTPSGISITLPAQGAETQDGLMMLNGNPNALFIRIATSPDARLVSLPQSPLFKKHGKPVRIKLECAQPNSMVWYKADNTFKTIAVGMPHLKTITHLDTLTLIVRQRVELQAIPISIQVPIARNTNN